jgi:hypothetical protein
MVRPVLVVVARIYCVASLKERRGLASNWRKSGRTFYVRGVPFARAWRVGIRAGDQPIEADGVDESLDIVVSALTRMDAQQLDDRGHARSS